MFSCSKNTVREILTDRFEVVFRGSEPAVARDLEQEFELRSMKLEAIDLLMAQHKTANHHIWVK